MQKLNINRENTHTTEYMPDTGRITLLAQKITKETSVLDSCVAIEEKQRAFLALSQIARTMVNDLNGLSYFFLDTVQNNEEVALRDNGREEEAHMNVTADGDILICKSEMLLPHRITTDSSSGKIRYTYDRELYATYFREGMLAFLDSHAWDMADSVFIYFIHHIGPDFPTDLDNLDPKVFIDSAVSRILVPDDKPHMVKYAMDSELYTKGKPYLEVYIGRREDVLNYISKKI